MGGIMIKYVRISIMLLFFAIFLVFNCKKAKVEGPAIQFESKVYEFGEVNKGTTVSHTFSFSNPGSDTLVLESVHPSCPSCTNIEEYDRILAPGRKGKIRATYEATGFPRFVAHKIYVTTNIPGTERIVLMLKGNIMGEINTIEIMPKPLDFGKIAPTDSIRESKVVVKNFFEKELFITDVISPNKKTEVLVETVQKGKEYMINVRLHSPFNKGEKRETITLKTNLEEKPEILVPYVYYFNPEE